MKKTDHISDDQLLAVLADHGSANADAARHLSICPECRHRRDRLERSLHVLGQMAERFSPSPSKPPIAIARQAYRSSARSKYWRRSLLSVGISAASLIVVVGLGSHLFLSHSPPEVAQFFSQEVIKDELFMEEISRLEEDAIPTPFMDIIDGPASALGTTPDGQPAPDPESENVS